MRKVVPRPSSLSTAIDPPWASTIALAIDNPSPVPPFFLARSGSILEKGSKILWEVLGADAPALVRDLEQEPVSIRPRPDEDGAPLVRRLHGVLHQGIERGLQPFAVGADRSLRRDPNPPRALGRRAPAAHQPDDERLDLDLGPREEARIVRRRQDQQAFGEPREPPELVEDDAGVARDLPVHTGVTDELRVTAGDRDRRPELVRGIADELSLPLEEPMFGLGQPARSPRWPPVSGARATPSPRTSRP